MFRAMLPVDLCGCPFMKEVYENDTGLTISSESLIDRIKRLKKVSNTDFKKRVNTSIRNKMKNDPSMESFDITTWYAVLQYACNGLAHPDDEAWITPGALENRLKMIKDFRNELQHSRFSISDVDLHKKLEEMRNHLVKAAELWKSKFSIDQDRVDQLVRSFHSTIDKISKTPLEDIDLNSFDKNALFNSLKSILKREGTADLETFFKSFSHVNPAALLVGQDIQVEVEHIFTPLQIVREGEDYFRDESYNAGSQSDEVCMNDILEIARAKGKQIILIEGIAGVGKTTVVKMLLSDWTGKRTVKGMDEIEFIIPVQCRNRSYDSVEKVVKVLMPTASKTFFGEEQRLMECLFDSTLLFIFDGLDELTEESEEIFTKLLGENNKNFTTICTMRPEKVTEFYQLISNRASVLHLRIEGISEGNRNRFVLTYCEKLRKIDDTFKFNVNGLLSYLRTTGARMQDHWYLPLNLTLLILLWGLDKARVCSITCSTELMIQIQELSLVRLKERLRARTRYSPEELERKIKEFESLLSEVALTGIRDSDLFIPTNEIEKLKEKCNILDLPSEELLGAFLIQHNSWSPATIVLYYMFPHKTGQEFYAATHIYNQVFQRQAYEDILRKANEILLYENASDHTIREVEELITKRENCAVSITDILSKMNREAIKPPSKKTYQGTLTILLGILQYHKELLVKEESASEILVLLNEAGVTKTSHWIRILNSIKCNSTVVKILIATVDNIMVENVRIQDTNVYAYATLLKYKMPRRLSISIKSNPLDIPRMEEIFQLLAQAKFTIDDLRLHYQFRNPGIDGMDYINEVLRKCRIENEYMGQIPCEGDLLQMIGGKRGKRSLFVPLASAEDSESLFSHLRWREEQQRPLETLGITVGNLVSASMLSSIPQGSYRNNLDIYLPDIQEEDEDDSADKYLKEIFGEDGREGGGRSERLSRLMADTPSVALSAQQSIGAFQLACINLHGDQKQSRYNNQISSERDLLQKVGSRGGKGSYHESLASAKSSDFSSYYEEYQRPLRGQPVGNLFSAPMLGSIPQGSYRYSLPQGSYRYDSPQCSLPQGSYRNSLLDIEGYVTQKGVGEDESVLERKGHIAAVDVLRTLNPQSYFNTLSFPRYQVPISSRGGRRRVEGISDLLKSLRGVKVRHGVFFPSRCRPDDPVTEEYLQDLCKRILRCESGIIWGSPPNRKDTVADMDTWE